MRQLLIGDIQGCYYEFLDLVEKFGPTDGDQIIAVGDIVDRAPFSKEVVQYFRANSKNTMSIMGNHERKHIESYHGRTPAALSQKQARREIGEADYPSVIAWFETLPKYLELELVDVVHGFFEPGVPLRRQWEKVIVGVMGGQRQLEQKYPDKKWYELYDGKKPLVVGHHNYTGSNAPFVYQNKVYGLDTGCCNGGALTGLELPSFKFLSIPARKSYWGKSTRNEKTGSSH